MTRPLLALLLGLLVGCRSTFPDDSVDPDSPFRSLAAVRSGLTNGSLVGAAVLADGRAFAGGTDGVMLRREGGKWDLDARVPGGEIVMAVWASEVGEVLAVAGSSLFYRAAEGWQEVSIGNDADLLDVWGDDAGNVWAVGVGGTMFCRSGNDPWRRVTLPVAAELWKVGGNSAHGYLAVGQSGVVLESADGSNWSQVAVPTPNGLFGAAMDDRGRAIAVGALGTILWRDEFGTWTDRSLQGQTNLFDAVVDGDGFLVAGDRGMMIRVTESGAVTVPVVGVGENFRVIAGTPGSRIVAGWYGTVLEERDGGWRTATTGTTLYGIHAPVDGEMMVVGRGGVAMTRRIDGSWQEHDLDTGVELLDIAGVTAASRVVVGDSGTIFRYTAGIWQREESGTSAALRSAWTDGQRTMIVGATGISLVNEGSGWREVPTGTDAYLRQVRGREWHNLWAVGDDGTALHFDGERWTPHPTPATTILRGVHVERSGTVWVVGDAGVLLQNVGSGFELALSPTALDLRGVTIIGGNLYAAGEGGRVWVRIGSSWGEIALGYELYFLAIDGGSRLLLVGEAGLVVQGKR